jgi:O-antigen/teichoic acid export membrane protein
VLNYSEYASLGVLSAMALEIPFYRGKNDDRRSEDIKNVTLSFSLLTSLLFSAGVLTYAFVRRDVLSAQVFYALIFAAGLVLLQRVNSYLITLLRAYKHFETAGKQMFLSSVVNAALIAALSFRYKLYGFMLAMCLSFLFNIAYILHKGFFTLKLSFDFKKLKGLVSYGFPLMVIALLGTFFETIDRIMITRYLGFEALGLYSIALMTYTYINSVPNAIGIVIIPNIQEKYGESENKESLKGYLRKAEMGLSALIPVMIGVSWFVVPSLVRLVLPKFVEGLDAMRYLILSAYFLAIGQIYSQFIYVIRKHLVILPIVAASLGLAVVSNWFALRLGYGIAGVAVATTIAMFFNFTLLHAYASRHIHTWGEFGASYLAVSLKFGFLVAALWVVTAFVRACGPITTACLQTSIFLLVYSPLLFRVNRAFGLTAMLRSRFKKAAVV